MTVHQSRHHGPLGTVIELQIEADSNSAALEAEQLALREIDRLEDVFSVYRPTSELSRWKRGEVEPGAELTEVLAESLAWQERTGGAYNPEVGTITELWERSAETGVRPASDELEGVTRLIASPGYSVGSQGVRAHRSPNGVNLNAFAKGWIVDRATRAAMDVDGVDGALVNAGGDLLNLGSSRRTVGIEDPLHTFDNVPPTAVVDVLPGHALATSGGARRGWKIGGFWFSHVIDPRTGLPAGHVASATVLARSAATADVVATALTVLTLEEGLELVESLPAVSCYLISADGLPRRSRGWPG